MPSTLDLDTWMATLVWTPESAESCVMALCARMRDESLSTWNLLVPNISAGLTCLSSNPNELYRLAAHIDEKSSGVSRNLLAMILASVNCQLPDNMTELAITHGAMLTLLHNKQYPITQRLAWLKRYPDHLLFQGGLGAHEGILEEPLNNALMLWFFMAANDRQIPPFIWSRAEMDVEFVASRKFLALNAPGIVDRIDIIQAMDLPYQAAVDMLIDDGRAVSLPELGGGEGCGVPQ